MRIERGDSAECPMGKLIIYAETPEEREWMPNYAGFGPFNEPRWRLDIYGMAWANGEFSSFSLGWRRRPPKLKWWQRWLGPALVRRNV